LYIITLLLRVNLILWVKMVWHFLDHCMVT
jgi:hypothetical protein